METCSIIAVMMSCKVGTRPGSKSGLAFGIRREAWGPLIDSVCQASNWFSEG